MCKYETSQIIRKEERGNRNFEGQIGLLGPSPRRPRRLHGIRGARTICPDRRQLLRSNPTPKPGLLRVHQTDETGPHPVRNDLEEIVTRNPYDNVNRPMPFWASKILYVTPYVRMIKCCLSVVSVGRPVSGSNTGSLKAASLNSRRSLFFRKLLKNATPVGCCEFTSSAKLNA